jgi:Flp pilus assembly pilin Flp
MYRHALLSESEVIVPARGARGFKRPVRRQTMLIGFIRDDRGQDLIEYTLLLAFVALASAAIFIGAGTSVSSIWNIANSRLIDANSVAS